MQEIEAKFAVPDRETFQRLQAMEDLCGYSLRPPEVGTVHDTYLDTQARDVLAAGYFCRRRESPQGVLITLKALTPPTGAVHRREEWETPLPGDAPLAQWPPGPVRDHLLQWVGNAPLVPLVELVQTRHVRTVMHGERTVANLSLDEIVFRAAAGQETALEVELELKGEGNEDDLVILAACLRREWGLSPQTRSKFERALALLRGPEVERLLQPDERSIVMQIAAREGRYARRARALLALDQGTTLREASQRGPLSRQRVRYWLRLLRERRLDIFPAHVRGALAERREAQAGTPSRPLLGDAGAPPQPLLSEAAPSSVSADQVPAQPAPPPVQLPDKPGIALDDSMTEAARKTFYFHLQRMLYHEPGTRLGEDIEALHDMRVATRRMRAALRVFSDHLNPQEMAPFAKGLRRTGRTLGAVRDLDVFREKMQAYLDTLPPERKAELDPLLAAWQAQREGARQELLAYLDSARYARFKERFGQFVQDPSAWEMPALTEDGDLIPRRVRHVVPVIIQERLASVRAHGEWVTAPDTPLTRFHLLRIASKELRYALEFFQEVLGPESKALINTMKALQDHLGNLQDAVVACNLLRDFLTWGTWGHREYAWRGSPRGGHAPSGSPRGGHAENAELPWPAAPVVAPGVATYLAVRQTEIQTLVQTFPPVWAQVASHTFQKNMESALRPLW